MNELPQTACLVVNPARADKFAFRQDRPQTLWQFLLKDLSTDERGGAWCCVCGQAVGFLLLRYSIKCWVLILVLSSFCITRRCRHAPISKGSFMLPNIYVSWSTSELSVRLVPLNMFNPSSILFYWPFQGGASCTKILDGIHQESKRFPSEKVTDLRKSWRNTPGHVLFSKSRRTLCL